MKKIISLLWLSPAHGAARLSWELAIARALPRALLLALAPIGFASAFVELSHPNQVGVLIEHAFNSQDAALTALKRALFKHALVALPVSGLLFVRELFRERQAQPTRRLGLAWLGVSLTGLPALISWLFEYRQPLLTGLIILSLAFSAAALVVEWFPSVAWSQQARCRVARLSLAATGLVFVAWIGFMAHWRFITFNAAAYDMSWETNAVHNIVHSGIPRTSVGAGAYYPGQLLPVGYAALHTPWVYYLYAPFYALYQDPRTLLWLQTGFMASGALGVWWFARRQLRSELLAAAFGAAYLLLPHVQLFCLHDIHANYLAIPSCLLALGAMEAGRPRLALALAFLTCVCREETATYAVALGLFWSLSRGNRRRVRYGWLTTAMSIAILLFITRWVMPNAGGTPRYSHFGMFFDAPGMSSLAKSLVLNPWGALSVFWSGPRLAFVWLSLLPFGLFALLGWRGLVFTLIPVGLLMPASVDAFFVVGVNYSAPIVVPVVVMSVLGARWLVVRLSHKLGSPARARLACGAFLLVSALSCSILYGNLFGKTYKLEFGGVPYRNSNEYADRGFVGIVKALPPFGERERLLWEVIERVPKGVPISTSGRINPQLSNREVSMLYPQLGAGYPRENLAKYVVLDTLPSLYEAPEKGEEALRASKSFRVFFENPSGVILERVGP